MKALTLTAAALGMALALPAQAAMTSAMEQSLIATCKASLSNSRLTFNNTMKVYRVNPYRVLDKLVCNGDDVATFAEVNGAGKVADLIRNRYYEGRVTIQDIAFNGQRLEVWFD